MKISTTFVLLGGRWMISCGPTHANQELQPGSSYRIIAPIYIYDEYHDPNNKQITRQTATAYLHAEEYVKKSTVAFQQEVPVGTILTILGKEPRPWYLPFVADRFIVKLDPDPSRGLEVVLDLNRGIEGSLDRLNPKFFARP